MSDLIERMLDHAALHDQLPDEEQQQWGNDLRGAADEIERLRERVRVLEDALRAMLTHMGMDDDERNKPTFDQARKALEKP